MPRSREVCRCRANHLHVEQTADHAIHTISRMELPLFTFSYVDYCCIAAGSKTRGVSVRQFCKSYDAQWSNTNP